MNTMDRLKQSLALAGWMISESGNGWAASKFILDSEYDRYFVIVPKSTEVRKETATIGIHAPKYEDMEVCLPVMAKDILRLMPQIAEVLLSSWDAAVVAMLEVEGA